MGSSPTSGTELQVAGSVAETGMFGPEDAGFVDQMVSGSLDGSMADHRWLVSEAENGAIIGGALIARMESELRRRGPDGAQVLIVETSSTEQYATTRTAPVYNSRMRWLVERRLRSSSAQIAAARAELRTLDEQVVSLADDASDLDTQAAVDGLGQTAYEHRRAQGQVDTINRERARLRSKIEALEARQDDLLDALNRTGDTAR